MLISFTIITINSTINSNSNRKGDATVGSPHRPQIDQFESFELIILPTFRQAILCRAVRADSISVNSTLPPS